MQTYEGELNVELKTQVSMGRGHRGALAVQPLTAVAAGPPELSKAQAQVLIDKYLSERATRITQAASKSAGRPLSSVPTTDAMQQRLRGDAAALDSVREFTRTTPSKGYVKAEVAVTIGQLTATGANTISVHADERTNLYFGHGDPRAPQYEGYRLRHDFTFVVQNGVWTLADTTPEQPAGPPVPTQATARPNRPPGSVEPGQSVPGQPSPAGVSSAAAAGAKPPMNVVDKLNAKPRPGFAPQYDYQAMYNYAAQYWDNYNPAYREFGNDCTSFISQIMQAGGWPEDDPDEVPDEPEGNIDHTMFVTGQQGEAGAATEIYLTYHSNDRWNVPFWGWLLSQTEPRDAWYAHRT